MSEGRLIYKAYKIGQLEQSCVEYRLEPRVLVARISVDRRGFDESRSVCARRKKRTRNRRMFFKRVKSHGVNLGHIGFDEELKDEPFFGFDDQSMAWSCMKSQQAAAQLVECVPLHQSTCISIPVDGRGNTYIFKVNPVPRRKIRVLSLFDGIGSALYTLINTLGLNVEIYYSSEVDGDALKVLKNLYHGQIVMLGCVRRLDAVLLHALGEIDLVIGGSPCNNLSRVNPRRLGLFAPESSGSLFFEFARIRNILSAHARNRGHPFFWFYEQTHHLDSGVCQTISRCLGSPPVKCCASACVPMRRLRNFWSNVPGLRESAAEMTSMSSIPLQDMLKPFRQANVTCLPTLTTNSASQQGHHRELPVVEDGIGSRLSITECEVLFGFPPHYTDCADLSISRRRKLLGRAWCIPLVGKLLHSLSDIFEKKM